MEAAFCLLCHHACDLSNYLLFLQHGMAAGRNFPKEEEEEETGRRREATSATQEVGDRHEVVGLFFFPGLNRPFSFARMNIKCVAC